MLRILGIALVTMSGLAAGCVTDSAPAWTMAPEEGRRRDGSSDLAEQAAVKAAAQQLFDGGAKSPWEKQRDAEAQQMSRDKAGDAAQAHAVAGGM